MIYLLTASHFEDKAMTIPPRLCGIYTRKQVAIIDASREVKQNVSDITRVYEVPDSLMNLCFYEIIKDATIVYDSSKKIKKSKVRVTDPAI